MDLVTGLLKSKREDWIIITKKTYKYKGKRYKEKTIPYVITISRMGWIHVSVIIIIK